MLNADGTYCFFCGKKFTEKDFPLQGRDKVEIHHINYVPEVKVLAHKKCHKKHHANLRKAKSNLIIK